MVATSHPLATRAGVRALEAGGNAVDAALAAAAMLTVCEPPHNGIGGDAFAQLWLGGELHGLNGSGRAPAHVDAPTVDPRRPALGHRARRRARLGRRRRALRPPRARRGAGRRDRRAHTGVAATARIAEHWRRRRRRAVAGAARPASAIACPTLRHARAIADAGPPRSTRARSPAIAAASWLSDDDLAAHRSEWVTPMRRVYRGVEVCELPPNTQGAAALVALGVADGLEGPAWRCRGREARARLGRAGIGDAPVDLPDAGPASAPGRPRGRARHPRVAGAGTTYLCVVDASATRSRASSRSSRASAPVWGRRDRDRPAQPRRGLHRGGGPPQSDRPGKRPFHTIMPGLFCATGACWLRSASWAQPCRRRRTSRSCACRRPRSGPAGGLDAARFRALGGRRFELEPGLAGEAAPARARPRRALADVPHGFGVGQMIIAGDDALVGGSDGRADGHAAGL